MVAPTSFGLADGETSPAKSVGRDSRAKVAAIDRTLVQLVPATRNACDQVTCLLKDRLWKAAQ